MCMIKIFQGGRGGDPFKPPPSMNNFCLYPPPVLRCFWKDPLMSPHPSAPLQTSFTATPVPIHHPFPPKNFDHTLCDKLMKEVDTSTPKVHSRNDPKSPISQAILDLIKERRKLRWLYNNTQKPNIKATINRLQKEIRIKINLESTISWEKFCNSISLESDPKASWRKITNFLKPKGPHSYPTPKSGNKTAKTNPEKAHLFAESVALISS